MSYEAPRECQAARRLRTCKKLHFVIWRENLRSAPRQINAGFSNMEIQFSPYSFKRPRSSYCLPIFTEDILLNIYGLRLDISHAKNLLTLELHFVIWREKLRSAPRQISAGFSNMEIQFSPHISFKVDSQ